MKKFVFSIMMSCLLAGGAVAQESVSRQNGSVMPSKAKRVPSRLVRGVEIDPLLWVHPEDKFYRIPELGIELIWDSNLEMLYVLELNHYPGTEISLDGKKLQKDMSVIQVLEVFLFGEDGRTALCLGKVVESGEEYWLDVAVRGSDMKVRIYENKSDDVIFTESFSSAR